MQYLIVRTLKKPGAIYRHEAIKWIIPSGEQLTPEQLAAMSPFGALRSHNPRVPHCRFITHGGMVYTDDGNYIFEVTDRPPAKTRDKVAETASVTGATIAAADLWLHNNVAVAPVVRFNTDVSVDSSPEPF